MCGINGIFHCSSEKNTQQQRSIVTKMNHTLRHRGPDDSGIWDSDQGLTLGHVRLSILDLSAQGHQPMHSTCGRYTVVFNGEIYNFQSIKSQLNQQNYRGSSDTEVMLNAFSQWGIQQSLAQFNGMFALAVWDHKDQTLTLARDKVGKKPLYYGRVGQYFVFSSELKTFADVPGFTGEVDCQALSLFLRYNYIPAPQSIFTGIAKLPSATYLTLPLEKLPSIDDFGVHMTPYWSASDQAVNGFNQPFQGTLSEAVDQLDDLLTDATQLRMVADVPIGILLSGGVDSTTVAGVMQKLSSRPVKSYSLGFEKSDKDEAQVAKKIAQHLKMDHHELYISGQDALSVVPEIPKIYDEPFADSSQIPTYLIAKLASQDITVGLTGDGGDELFYGYNRYFRNNKSWSVQRKIPHLIKNVMAKITHMREQRHRFETPLSKTLADISAHSALAMYSNRISKWQKPEQWVLNTEAVLSDQWGKVEAMGIEGCENNMMLFDYLQYLCDDILVKVDRASMANSLELRSPLLDTRLAEFAWRLPMAYKYQKSRGKHVLRQVLHRYVPSSLTQQPKKGFGSPIKQWLKGPLQEWAEDLLSADRLRQQGFFNVDYVRHIWLQYKDHNQKYHTHLWNILMFQAWYENMVKRLH